MDEETAEDALELIKVEYELLPFVLDAEEAVKPGRATASIQREISSGSEPIPSYGETLKKDSSRQT